jgi:hypothetical protein
MAPEIESNEKQRKTGTEFRNEEGEMETGCVSISPISGMPEGDVCGRLATINSR